MGLCVGEEEVWVWVDFRDLSRHLRILLGLLKSVAIHKIDFQRPS